MFNLTFQQIETFLAVAQYQSLSKASETLYISQPALSKTLQRFEENIGLPLFNRTNQGVLLTEAGKWLYTTLKPLYDHMDRAIQSVKDMTSPEEKYLHIAVPVMYDFSEDFDIVKQYIKTYKEAYPDVTVMETIYELKDFQNSLQIGFFNLIVAPSFSLAKTQNLTVRRLGEVPLYITMSSDHPLAKQGALQLDALSKESFIAVPYVDELYDKGLVLDQCRQNGFVPKSVGRPPNFQTVVHALKNGSGLSICWKLRFASNDTGLKFFPLLNLREPLYTVIAWRPERLSHTARDFIAMLPKA